MSVQVAELLVQVAELVDELFGLVQSLPDVNQLCIEGIAFPTLVVAGTDGFAGGSPIILRLLLDEVEQPVVVPPDVGGPATGVQGGTQ